MKKLALLLTLIISSASVSATECSDYLSELYTTKYSKAVTVKAKRERREDYTQQFGNKQATSIIYGKGWMKIEGNKKKKKISYTCLLDDNKTPLWGYVMPR